MAEANEYHVLMDHLPYRASLSEYQRQAEAVLTGWKSGDESALRFFWQQHPRFRRPDVLWLATPECRRRFDESLLTALAERLGTLLDEILIPRQHPRVAVDRALLPQPPLGPHAIKISTVPEAKVALHTGG